MSQRRLLSQCHLSLPCRSALIGSALSDRHVERLESAGDVAARLSRGVHHLYTIAPGDPEATHLLIVDDPRSPIDVGLVRYQHARWRVVPVEIHQLVSESSELIERLPVHQREDEQETSSTLHPAAAEGSVGLLPRGVQYL